MNKVTLITTRNSIYAVSESDLGAEVRCLVGTFAGSAWELTRADLDVAVLTVGSPMVIGGLTTSTVLGIQDAWTSPRATRPAMGFVEAVVDHVRQQAAPVAIRVDDPRYVGHWL